MGPRDEPEEPGSDLEDTLFQICDVLEGAEVRYLVTGALVRNYFGVSRTSLDVDIVIHPEDADPDGLADLFEEHGVHVEGVRKGDMGERLVLGFPDLSADLWLPSGHPLHHEEFERRHEAEYRGRTIPLIGPTDYILRKLVNFYRTRRNTNDLDDAYQVLLYAWDLVDVDALLERATVQRVREEAEELVKTVREDRADLETGEDPVGP